MRCSLVDSLKPLPSSDLFEKRAYRVYDTEGTLADCVIFAKDQASINQVFAGDAPRDTPVTREFEITPINCRVLNVYE